MKKLSSTARLLKDVAAERQAEERERKEREEIILGRVLAINRGASTALRLRLIGCLESCEEEKRREELRHSTKHPENVKWEENTAEQWFIAEALRHATKLMLDPEPEVDLGRPSGDAFLLGFFSCLHPNHPARGAIRTAYVMRDIWRRKMLEMIQTGDYGRAEAAARKIDHLAPKRTASPIFAA